MADQLKQVLLISEDVRAKYTDKEMQKFIAKAPLKLLTRCFETSEAFVGRDESQHFHKVVTDWIDNQDTNMELLSTQTVDENETYLWTAEMMGVPSVHVRDGDSIVCTVLGPALSEELDEITVGCEEY